MDSPWNDDATPESSSHIEWSKISSEFTNAGYREGITAGKESALQEGFDAGFAQDPLLAEARAIAVALADVRFSDISPRDLEAEAHAREHLALDDDDNDENPELRERREMEALEDMLGRLTPGPTNPGALESTRPTMVDVQKLADRIQVLTQTLGVNVDRS
ncbi:hypothetical protein C8F01DRAFT_1149291 [Mycena amicta]|nr:hypothetical protein C8F01DRAFT_1149291 [Mycena amicta]